MGACCKTPNEDQMNVEILHRHEGIISPKQKQPKVSLLNPAHL
jgi:hypothetical protein